MKHACLILAHNEFELLSLLVGRLDDIRNDIYIHFDKKVKDFPKISVRYSNLVLVDNRIDVRWGDYSVVEAEYSLFSSAVQNGPYEYYHLLSGVDLPLKSQDYIHTFFANNSGKEFIGYTLTEITPEIVRKAQRWHIFSKEFRSSASWKRALRSSTLILQELLAFKRNRSVDFKKGSQWVSVTDNMARYFLEKRQWSDKVFRNTFCSDEMVMQTLCWSSPYKNNIYDTHNDGRGCMRAISWRGSVMIDWNKDDFDLLSNSDALFARKFNLKDKGFIDQVLHLCDDNIDAI